MEPAGMYHRLSRLERNQVNIETELWKRDGGTGGTGKQRRGGNSSRVLFLCLVVQEAE